MVGSGANKLGGVGLLGGPGDNKPQTQTGCSGGWKEATHPPVFPNCGHKCWNYAMHISINSQCKKETHIGWGPQMQITDRLGGGIPSTQKRFPHLPERRDPHNMLNLSSDKLVVESGSVSFGTSFSLRKFWKRQLLYLTFLLWSSLAIIFIGRLTQGTALSICLSFFEKEALRNNMRVFNMICSKMMSTTTNLLEIDVRICTFLLFFQRLCGECRATTNL